VPDPRPDLTMFPPTLNSVCAGSCITYFYCVCSICCGYWVIWTNSWSCRISCYIPAWYEDIRQLFFYIVVELIINFHVCPSATKFKRVGNLPLAIKATFISLISGSDLSGLLEVIWVNELGGEYDRFATSVRVTLPSRFDNSEHIYRYLICVCVCV